MQCAACHKELRGESGHRQGEAVVCEDCFIDKVPVIKTCDPWAVYSASRTAVKEPGLTETQRRLVAFLRSHGPASLGQLMAELGISEEEVRGDFTVLRHIQMAGAKKQGNEVVYSLWQDYQYPSEKGT
jgi:DNA-binding CsgD family transcriptional regulator